MNIHAIKTVPPVALGQCARPECAAPALPHCGLVIASLAGPLKAYFCLSDYLQVLGVLQALEVQGEGNPHATPAIPHLRKEILPPATRLPGGPRPPPPPMSPRP